VVVETYKASNLSGRAKAADWSRLYSSRLDQVNVTQADRDGFDAEFRVAELGPIRVVRLTCSGSRIDRQSQHIGPDAARFYSLILQAQGTGAFAHYGHDTLLAAGDVTLCDSAAPHSLRLGEGSEVVMLRFPARLLKEHLPSPEYFCGRRLPAAEGLTHTVAAVVLSLCAQLERGLAPGVHDRVSRHLLDLIATSYAIAFDSQVNSSSIISGRHAMARLFVEQHLRDPELTPCSIASQLKLSSRYLRMIFATSSETVSAYILRRRLEECARQLSDPHWSGHSIAEIAFGWGFNSASHFTRSFRDRYGASPRHYRRGQLDQQAPTRFWQSPVAQAAVAC
jgi:AraC family transcriptional regulator, positive regulator of tynA and feaB